MEKTLEREISNVTIKKMLKKLPKHTCSEAEVRKTCDLVLKRREIYEKYLRDIEEIDKAVQSTDMYIFDGPAYCHMLSELNDIEV